MYDAFLLISFGGPERREDVLPFLENVLRGRNVPRERMLEVAEHYYHFGGRSPINEQNRALIAALKNEFAGAGIDLPIYFGNRNWHPLLPQTLRQMKADGVRRAIALATSALGSYAGCRQYLENIAAAQAELGDEAPQIDKLRPFHNHPGFIEAMADRTRQALERVPAQRRPDAELVFTAHSIPLAMAQSCHYERQFHEASRGVAQALGHSNWRVAYQSRSGPPSQPWLGPDILAALAECRSADVVVVPIGFLSDHIEVLYDLDEEAHNKAGELGLNLVRAATVGTHPRFVRMIRELVQARLAAVSHPDAGPGLGPSDDVCAPDCCKYEPRRPLGEG